MHSNQVLFCVQKKTYLSMHNFKQHIQLFLHVFFAFKHDLSQSLWSSGSEIHLTDLAACCLSSGVATHLSYVSDVLRNTRFFPIPQDDSNNILRRGTLSQRSAFHLGRLPCIIPDTLPKPLHLHHLYLNSHLGGFSVFTFVPIQLLFTVHGRPLECSCKQSWL